MNEMDDNAVQSDMQVTNSQNRYNQFAQRFSNSAIYMQYDPEFETVLMGIPRICRPDSTAAPYEAVYFTLADIGRYENLKYENTFVLNPYWAIYDSEKRTIEAAISSINQHGISRVIGGPSIVLTSEVDTGENECSLSIGTVSMELKTLFAGADYSIRIENIAAEGPTVLSVLERISDALAYSIGKSSDLGFVLCEQDPYDHIFSDNYTLVDRSKITFPQSQYSHRAMSLYLYGLAAGRSPLLQFLAYYQVLEYYAPESVLRNNCERVGEVLSDPKFTDNQKSLEKVVNVIKFHRAEIDTLHEVLLYSFNKGGLKERLDTFFSGLQQRSYYYYSKKEKGDYIRMSAFSVWATGKANSKYDIRKIMQRIYEIRCRIVHTKGIQSGKKLEALMPYMVVRGELHFDIALVRLLAECVLDAYKEDITLC